MALLGDAMSCVAGTTVDIAVEIKLLSGVADRYDIGLWINQDGESARTGTACYRDTLTPLGTTTVCDHTASSPTYWNGDADACGDTYASGTDPCGTRVLEGGEMVTKRSVVVSVLCSDADDNGVVDTGVCASWEISTEDICQGVFDAQPGTGSRCSCGIVDIADLYVEPCSEVACDEFDTQCSNFSCVAGQCVPTHTNEGGSCDDGVACTSDSTCSAGVCGDEPPVCDMPTPTPSPTPSVTATRTATATFTATATITSTPSPTRSATATFTPVSPTATATPGGIVLDADDNGSTDPLTDGVLFARYLFGFRGSALVTGALGDGANRDSPEEVEAYITSILGSLDVDGNESLEPLCDGILILRYLFAFHDNALIAGAIGQGASRTTADAIESYLAGLN